MGSADSHRDLLRIHPPDAANAAEDQASDTTTTARGCYCTAASRGRLPKPRDCEAAHHAWRRRAPLRAGVVAALAPYGGPAALDAVVVTHAQAVIAWTS